MDVIPDDFSLEIELFLLKIKFEFPLPLVLHTLAEFMLSVEILRSLALEFNTEVNNRECITQYNSDVYEKFSKRKQGCIRALWI